MVRQYEMIVGLFHIYIEKHKIKYQVQILRIISITSGYLVDES